MKVGRLLICALVVSVLPGWTGLTANAANFGAGTYVEVNYDGYSDSDENGGLGETYAHSSVWTGMETEIAEAEADLIDGTLRSYAYADDYNSHALAGTAFRDTLTVWSDTLPSGTEVDLELCYLLQGELYAGIAAYAAVSFSTGFSLNEGNGDELEFSDIVNSRGKNIYQIDSLPFTAEVGNTIDFWALLISLASNPGIAVYESNLSSIVPEENTLSYSNFYGTAFPETIAYSNSCRTTSAEIALPTPGAFPEIVSLTPGVELVSTIPEPSTLFLLGSGLAGIIGLGRKRLFRKA